MLDCRRLEKSAVFRWKSFFRSRKAQQICQDQEGWAVKSCRFHWSSKISPKEDALGKLFWSRCTYPNWVYDEFRQIHWCNWRKSHSRFEKGIDCGGIFSQDLAPCLLSKKVKSINHQKLPQVHHGPGSPEQPGQAQYWVWHSKAHRLLYDTVSRSFAKKKARKTTLFQLNKPIYYTFTNFFMFSVDFSLHETEFLVFVYSLCNIT